MPSALPRSLVVSVLPVPAGPAGAPPITKWRLWEKLIWELNENLVLVIGSLDADLRECDVTSVCQRCDDQPWCVAEILVPVAELSVADVGEAVLEFRWASCCWMNHVLPLAVYVNFSTLISWICCVNLHIYKSYCSASASKNVIYFWRSSPGISLSLLLLNKTRLSIFVCTLRLHIDLSLIFNSNKSYNSNWLNVIYNLLCIVPSVPELRLPHEGEDRLDLGGDQLAHNVAAVDVDRADCHDLLPMKHGEMINLFFLV